ncbi:MAG TPA: hypothetical protein PKA74_10895, partial [Bauldia sp.]|nr:hypothetical protein [Bauldia sp.]
MAFTTYTVGTAPGPGVDFTSIQAAINAASNGDVIQILDGTYVLPSTLNLEKDITLQGQSEAGVILDASAIDGYGIYLTGNGATLSTFTLLGPAGGAPGGNYGIKAQPAVGETEVNNLTLEHLTVTGSLRSEIDLNGV